MKFPVDYTKRWSCELVQKVDGTTWTNIAVMGIRLFVSWFLGSIDTTKKASIEKKKVCFNFEVLYLCFQANEFICMSLYHSQDCDNVQYMLSVQGISCFKTFKCSFLDKTSKSSFPISNNCYTIYVKGLLYLSLII